MNKPKKRSWIRRIGKILILAFTIVLSLLYLLVCLVPYCNPQWYWWSGFLSLAAPYIMLILVFTIIFWLIAKPINTLIPIVVLLIGYKHIKVCLGFKFSNPFVNEKKADNLRIVNWNVQSFNGLTKDRNIKRIIRNDVAGSILKLNADIVCLQEFNHSYNGGKEADNIGLFKVAFPYYYFSKDYTRHNGAYVSGCIIFSKYKIAAYGRVAYPGSESLIWADVCTPTDTIRVYTTHLQSFKFKQEDYTNIEKIKEQDATIQASKNVFKKMLPAFKRRGLQADMVQKSMALSPYKTLICGDFNDVPGSYTYCTIRGTKSDAFLQKSFGVGRTFVSLAPTLRIDYIMTDQQLKVQQFDMVDEGLSDHIMLVADIKL